MSDSSPQLLLIWCNIPDEMKAFAIPHTSELASIAIASAGKYINGDELEEDHPIFHLNNRLEGDHGLEEIPITEPILGNFSTVVICGFIL